MFLCECHYQVLKYIWFTLKLVYKIFSKTVKPPNSRIPQIADMP